jgi:hypothetical protein
MFIGVHFLLGNRARVVTGYFLKGEAHACVPPRDAPTQPAPNRANPTPHTSVADRNGTAQFGVNRVRALHHDALESGVHKADHPMPVYKRRSRERGDFHGLGKFVFPIPDDKMKPHVAGGTASSPQHPHLH